MTPTLIPPPFAHLPWRAAPGSPAHRGGNAPVLMPATAYRKTYFANALDEYCGAGKFRRLLAALAPQEHARVQRSPNRSAIDWLVVLVRHIHQHCFPLHGYFIAEVQDGDDELAENYAQAGIPYDALGVNWFDDEIDSPALALCVEMSPDGESMTFACLDAQREALRYWMRDTTRVAPFEHWGDLRPPRGRAWIEPWDAVAVLYKWAQSQTGNPWLDVSPLIWNEDATLMPPWNLGEIRSLTRAWESAQPQYARALALMKHVDAKPAERLPLLAGAIRGDRATPSRISVPTGKRTTLAHRLGVLK